MYINSKNIYSVSEANKDFSKISRRAGEVGEVTIFKYNKPAYLLLDINKYNEGFLEKLEELKMQYICEDVKKEYSYAFKELAK